jgi:hypothetical protein
MKKEDIERVIQAWKNHLLVGHMEGYHLEIADDVPPEFAAIALFLDSKTVRASGEVEEFYEGYRQAAVDILNLIGVEISQDDQMRVISLFRKESGEDKQEELKRHIWG